jgi:chemotaxis protein histidine kinase CheA
VKISNWWFSIHDSVINLRGKITAIYDLGERFGMGKRNYDEEAKIIVTNKEKAGFIADVVKEIIHKDNVITVLNLENFKENKGYEKNSKN